MNVTAQKKVINIRFRNLAKYYAAIRSQMGIEDVHRFRVEIKKMRAFLRLISIAADKKIKIPARLKRVYHSAGVLRDLQVHRQTLRGSQKIAPRFTSYSDHIDREINEAEKDLRKLMRNKELPEAQVKIEKHITRKISSEMIRKFYQDKLTAVRVITSSGFFSNEALHTIRKNIKDILYTAKTFETDLHKSFPSPGWDRKKELYFIQLADQLGRFQDYSVELLHLRKSKKKMTIHQKKLAESLLLKNEQLKSNLVQLLKSHFVHCQSSIIR